LLGEGQIERQSAREDQIKIDAQLVQRRDYVATQMAGVGFDEILHRFLTLIVARAF
jgi:hypothetical protein